MPGLRAIQRGGARVGSNWSPDIQSAQISPISDTIVGFPANYGRNPPDIWIDVVCRT